MAAIQAKIEPLYDLGMPRNAIAAALSMPVETVDDYFKRIADDRRAHPLPKRAAARRSQYERTMGQIRTLHATAGRLQQDGNFAVAAKYHGEIDKREKRISRIMGTEAPKVIHLAGEGGGPVEVEAVVLTSDEKRRRAAGLAEAARARLKADVPAAD